MYPLQLPSKQTNLNAFIKYEITAENEQSTVDHSRKVHCTIKFNQFTKEQKYKALINKAQRQAEPIPCTYD